MKIMRQKTVILFIALFILIFSPFLFGYWNLYHAQDALQKQDFPAAYSSFSRAAKLLFWRSDLHEQAGLAAGYAKDYPLAIETLSILPNLSKNGWAMLAASYFHTGNPQESIQAYQNGINAYPQSVRLYEGLIYVFHSQKDWRQEFNTLTQQVQLDEKNPYAAYRLALLSTIFKSDESLSLLTRASTLDPELDSAAQTIRAALAESAVLTDDSQKKVVIGRALGLVNEWELAQFIFEQAVQINADNAEAWAWLGEARQQNGQDGSGELDQALNLNSRSAVVRALRGLYWSRQKNYGKMLTEYLLAAQYEPQNPAWSASTADAYFKLGDLNEALIHYQRAVELAPKESNYYRLLAVFCAENGVRVEELGLPAALKSVEISPNDPAALDALGLSYFSTGRFANAEQTYQQALQIDPQYFPAHLHLAVNHLAQGNHAAAFNELTYVRDADISGIYSETARQLLEQYFP